MNSAKMALRILGGMIFGVCLSLLSVSLGCKKEQGQEAGKTGAMKSEKQGEAEVKKVGEVSGEREVQSPVVAGQFYPGQADELRVMIQGFLAQAQVPAFSGVPLGFMVPHAGYPYSGPVAAYVYQAIKVTGSKRFVILGASHRVGFPGVYVMDKDAYRTPLGEAKIDRETSRKLAQSRSYIQTDERLYDHEHSVEVQIPFLQEVVGPELSLVVMVIGRAGPELASDLAQALNQTFPQNDVIFLASSDMAHGNYPPYKGSNQIRPIDTHTLELIQALDIPGLAKGLADDSTPLCGGLPVLTLMNLAKLRGAQKAQVLKYADSGDATGDHSQVVGYGAVAFLLPAEKRNTSAGSLPSPTSVPPPAGYSLSEEEKRELLKMARAMVNAAVKGERLPQFSTTSATLQKEGAAFVTLKTHGQLRGCIGSIIATEPLYLCVQRRAVDAALHDSRFVFNRIKPTELSELEIEISVLTPLQNISRPEEVRVGRDGVVLSLGPYHGVFLPQVPVEQGWNLEQYLQNLCHKAGLSDPNCFRDPAAQLQTFQAIVFSEKEMGMTPP